MNCANHPEAPVAAYCRTCGKPLCEQCKREALGTVFCAEHVPANAGVPLHTPPAMPVPPYDPTLDQTVDPHLNTAPGSATPPFYTPPGAGVASATAPAHPGSSPGLAFLLGLIPGVGAIYNGQYAKGLIHAVVFGIFISILDSNPPHGLEPLVAILMAVWFFYMAFEAYHTARKRRDGQRVDEFSSLVDLSRRSGRFPVGAVVLIVLGVLLLLDQTDIFPLARIVRFWPIALIAIGVYMLYSRLEPGGMGPDIPSAEAPHERR